MGKIKKLDDILANKIAAGEVVERPASVVKELVENAIDANSTVVEIELEEAGLGSICILDNGDGMEAEDCLLAFERHATSKIKDENDLFRIRTLGFRGEALASIASVSELELKTSTGEEAGTFLHLKGGEVVKQAKSTSRKGTEITVRNLFFNTPARLKYMKTIHTELGNITDIVNRIALANPDVSIKLTHHDKKILHTNGNGDVRQVLAAIYGINVARKLVKIEEESLDFTITGYMALPEVNRASRNYITMVVNGRYVKSLVVQKAILEGFHTLLPIGRYPVGYLSISMDPILVDVNVHPTKLEVRFSKETELYHLIIQGIKEAFRRQRLIPDAVQPKKNKKIEAMQEAFAFEHRTNQESVSPTPSFTFPKHVEEKLIVQETLESPLVEEMVSGETMIPEAMREIPPKEETFSVETEVIEEEAEKLPPLYPIGQMHGTYILAQNENGLYIIDQHAAQERIKYEYFREKVGEVHHEVQEMLIPHHIELSSSEYMLLDENKEQLTEIGLFLESFGHNAFIVRSHPQWFPKGEETAIIDDIVQQVIKDKKADIRKLREEAAIMMSCKGSIKANRHLRNDEIFALLESLRKTEAPFTCPHGRPVIIQHSTYELEKMFKRVM